MEYLQAIQEETTTRKNKIKKTQQLCEAMAEVGLDRIDAANTRIYRYGDKLAMYESRDKLNKKIKIQSKSLEVTLRNPIEI